MLADIYKKLENIHVQSTCRINTPLITKCLQSPIVSKNAALAKHHQTAPQQASQLLSSKQVLCQHTCLHALGEELFVHLKQMFAACRCWIGYGMIDHCECCQGLTVLQKLMSRDKLCTSRSQSLACQPKTAYAYSE